jgi:syntaxin 1B/2/3
MRKQLSVTDNINRVDHTDKAVVSAQAARKKRWICFGLFILLLAIVAAVVAGVVVTNNNKK